MEPEAKYTLVGIAVLVLLALLAGALVWLRSTGEGANAREYKIYFERQSLQGLELRSNVTMRGMRVGSVTALRFSASRPAAAEVIIAVHPTTPVRISTQASVERHLLTGLATIRLENIDEQSPALTDLMPDEPYPVIPEGTSPMQQASEILTQLVQTADETLQRLNATLTPENRAALAGTLRNLQQITQRADGLLARADATLLSVGKAAEEGRVLARSVSEDARRLAARYDGLGADASASAREISAAVKTISADVERLTRRADALLASTDDELRASAQALRSAADSVGAAAGRLRDPQQAIFGPAQSALGPGEGTP